MLRVYVIDLNYYGSVTCVAKNVADAKKFMESVATGNKFDESDITELPLEEGQVYRIYGDE